MYGYRPRLVMIGHGTTGADGITPGNHLRWVFDRRMGFPLGRFALYRRPSGEAEIRLRCVTFEALAGQTLEAPFTLASDGAPDLVAVDAVRWPMRVGPSPAGGGASDVVLFFEDGLTVTLPEPAWRVNLRIHRTGGGRGVVAVSQGRQVMAEVSIPDARGCLHDVELTAPHFKTIAITIRGAGLLELCYAPVGEEAGAAWELISGPRPISLPITHLNYPLTHRHAGRRDGDLQEALSRVPRGAYDQDQFVETERLLFEMFEDNPVGSKLRGQHRYVAEGNGAPSVSMVPADLLLAAAADPRLAMVAGLYVTDADAEERVPYDYKIVGTWPPRSLWLLDTSVIVFDDLPAGRTFFPWFTHGGRGVCFAGADARVVQERSTLADTDKALRFSQAGLTRVGIYFPEPVGEIQVFVSSHGALPPGLRGYRGSALVASITGTARQEILSLSAARMDRVEVEGEDFSVHKVCYDPEYLGHGDHTYIIHGVVREAPPRPRPPGDVVATPFSGATRREPDGSVTDARLCVGVRWKRPDRSPSLLERSVVRYVVKRRGPDGGERVLNREAPLVVDPTAADPVGAPPPHWPDPRPHFVDVVDDVGQYAYGVAGVDIFGRTSDFSPMQPAMVSHELYPPPPAPLGVEARYVDLADPWLSDTDKSRMAQAGDQAGVAVSWRWPADAHEQNPDVHAFHVHLQTGWLNKIPATISEATGQGSGGLAIRVDITEPTAVPAGVLAGCMLQASRRASAISDNAEGVRNGDRLEIALTATNSTGFDETPAPGPCVITLAPACPLHADYRESGVWEHHRLLSVEKGDQETYSVIISPPPFAPSRLAPKRYAQVGVSADDGRHESVVSIPASVVALHRAPPPLPTRPEATARLASFPDVHGKAVARISWPADAAGYRVHRAVDVRLFQVDRRGRRNGRSRNPADFDAYLARFDETRRPAISETIVQPDEVAYPDLDDELLQALADLPGNEWAFVTLHDGVIAAHAEPGGAGGVFYVDRTLSGRGANRYCYRVQPVDVTGNQGELGPSSLPVQTRNVAPPPKPAALGATGGDRSIRIRWRAVGRADVSAYRIFRSESAADARDTRLMALVATLPVTGAVEYAWTDETPVPLRPYFYRVIAVRRLEPDTGSWTVVNSPPGGVVMGRAFDLTPPSPLEWREVETGWVHVAGATVVEWDDEPGLAGLTDPVPAVRLVWMSPDAGLDFMIQRRVVGDYGWTTVSDWDPHAPPSEGVYSFLDRSAPAGANHAYRIKARKRTGTISDDWISLSVGIAPSEGRP